MHALYVPYLLINEWGNQNGNLHIVSHAAYIMFICLNAMLGSLFAYVARVYRRILFHSALNTE